MSLRVLAIAGGLCAALCSVSCSRGGSAQVRTYPMGERVHMGALIYTVFETQWLTQIGEGPNQRVPQQRYFLVRMSITNSGGSEIMVPTMSVVDDKGEAHTELSNGEGVPQWMGYLRQLPPAQTAQGNIVFDVAPKHYKLRIADENEQRIGLIDIPLSFGAETPDLGGPAPAHKQ